MNAALLKLDPPPESYGKALMHNVSDSVGKLSEMHEVERAFVTGLLMHYKPQKVLELGVSAGAGTITILNAIKDVEGAHLYSVDLFEKYYRDQSKSSGWMVGEYIPECNGLWTAFLGKDISEVIDEIGNGIDFLVLDTAHVHPVETLNFLCVLPFLNDGAIVVLHDVSLFLKKGGFKTASYACGLLLSSVTADILMPVEKYAPYANIGAFQITGDTRKYIKNVFMSLFFPWGRLYAKPWRELVPQAVITPVADLFGRYYGDEYQALFLDSVKAQDDLYSEISFLSYVGILIGEFLRSIVKLFRK